MSDFNSIASWEFSIPGNPSDLYTLAQLFRRLNIGLMSATNELGSIDAGSWEGMAADAFRSVFRVQPQRYASAADEFSGAANAITNYADALADAQSQASMAYDLYQAGHRATSTAVAAGTSQVADPGASMREEAIARLGRAKASLEVAQSQIVSALDRSRALAPSHGGLFGRVDADVREVVHVGIEFGKGFAVGVAGMVEGVYDLAKLSWEFSPQRMLIDPSGYIKSDIGAVKTVVKIAEGAAAHPGQFAKMLGENLVDWNEWAHDPSKALGELVPGVILAIATSGGGTAAEAIDVVGKGEDLMSVGEAMDGAASRHGGASHTIDGELIDDGSGDAADAIEPLLAE